MTGNYGTGKKEHKRKVNESLLMQRGHQNMPKSPKLCTPIRKEWPETLSNDNVISNEASNLNRCVTFLAGSGLPSASSCSMVDSEHHIVEELPVRNYKNLNTALVNYSNNSRQPQRKFQLAIESRYNNSFSRERVEELIPFRLGKGGREEGTDSEIRRPKSLSSKNENFGSVKVSASISNVDKTITSSYAHLINSTGQNASSTYNNVSELIVKQTVKGKGKVVCKDLDNSISLGRALMSQEENEALLRSNADDIKPSMQGIAKSSAESCNDGVNLREWMMSADHKMSKSGRLHIFKQILDVVDFAYSQGVVLQDLTPSCFTLLLPSSKVKYIGSSGLQELDRVITCNETRKRPLEQDIFACQSLCTKQKKLCEEIRSLRQQQQQQQQHFTSIHGCRTTTVNHTDSSTNVPVEPRSEETRRQNSSSCQHTFTEEKQFISVTIQLEKKWYCSPEELNDGVCTFTSNIYSLGVLLFELLCNIESWEMHSVVMSDLCHRILPPKFLSENPKEAGFCLWLLHPEPSSRPDTRMILESEFIRESVESNSGDVVAAAVSEEHEAETEQLLHFLISLEGEKKKQTTKLQEELSWLDEDIKEIEKGYSLEDPSNSYFSSYIPRSCVNEAIFMRNINQLENSYFSLRFQGLLKQASAVAADYDHKDVLESRWRRLPQSSSVGCLGSFFEGLCKFARYSKFEERGTLRNRDLLSSANVICALSFDRDEDYIAAAGVSKKIKIFDFSTILNDSIDIQYPVVEMSNKSKLSSVCWNKYIKNHLASTDYDGVVQMWDTCTGQPLSQYMEHQKRAWSVHFSLSDPNMFASGSDDCSVKLWNISESNSIGTIWNPANVCCVQFSAYSPHLLFFGSADYKVYGYDLRNTRVPWCTLSGHGKAVSYVKFLDTEAVISASTDNSLKLWDLKKTSSSGLPSDACDLTFKGHSNEKNFVGLSVSDGYIACGSETNEVYCYHKSLPVPITSHKFESTDPISGHSNIDDNSGQFVSSVCWRKKSNMLVAANSIGIVKLLQMV